MFQVLPKTQQSRVTSRHFLTDLLIPGPVPLLGPNSVGVHSFIPLETYLYRFFSFVAFSHVGFAALRNDFLIGTGLVVDAV